MKKKMNKPAGRRKRETEKHKGNILGLKGTVKHTGKKPIDFHELREKVKDELVKEFVKERGRGERKAVRRRRRTKGTMKKRHKIKATKKLLKQLRPFWQEFMEAQGCYHTEIAKLEERMMKKTGIKDIEFFFCDNEIAGIGNVTKTMRLIHNRELEE